MRGIRIVATALAALAWSACTGVIGDGKASKESRELGSFTRVSTSAGIAVDVTRADFAVVVEADCNILRLIKTEVVGDELRIGIKDGTSVWPKLPMQVRISMPSLAGLSTSGGAKAKAHAVDSGELAVAASGSSEVTIDGKASSLTVELSGASRVSLQDLQCESAKVSASGGSTLQAPGLSSHALTLSASGASQLTIAGTAESLDIEATGASRVELKDLAAQTVQLNASGGSQATSNATVHAQVEVSGGSTVTVLGGGAIDKNVSGGSSVTAE